MSTKLKHRVNKLEQYSPEQYRARVIIYSDRNNMPKPIPDKICYYTHEKCEEK